MNSGKDLPLDYRCLNETDETDYSFLTINDSFTVYGLMFFSTRVDYLICKKNKNPTWVPANLFEIITNELPENWSICITFLDESYKVLHDSMKIQAIISYPKLVKSISHYIGVTEGEPKDLSLFFLEQEKIDNKS